MKCTDLLFTFIMRCRTLNHRFLANQNTVMTRLFHKIIIIIIMIIIIIIIIIQHEVVLVVVGARRTVRKRLGTWLHKLGATIRMRLLQKTALLGTARILRKGVGRVKEKDMAASLGVVSV